MNMEAVWRAISVLDVDTEPVPGTRVEDGAWDAPRERRLVDVGSNELVRLGNQVLRVEVFAIDKRCQSACGHLVGGNRPILMPFISHAVTPVLDWGRYVAVRFDW